MPKAKKIPFSEIITELLDISKPFSPTHLHRFSDLEQDDLKNLKNAWNRIDPARRLSLLTDLEEMAEADTLMDFDEVALIGLNDLQGDVRAQAAGMLWENSSTSLAEILEKMVEQDPSVKARAAAASALGKFILLGELDEIPAVTLHKAEECLIKAARGSADTLVRRKAIEALGFSSRPEVPPMIRDAYDSREPEWIVSALFAMGVSYDMVWEADVKRELQSPKGDIQIEAVRAAGKLGLQSTKRILLNLLEDEATDSEIRAEIIWALSEIGGEQVRESLEDLLEKTEDEEEVELLNEAIDNLTLNEQIESLDLFDIDLEEEARSAHIIDLTDDVTDGDDEESTPTAAVDSDDHEIKKPRRLHKKT
jgi:HEAT repeat protein